MHGLVLGSGTGQHPYLTREECNRLFELGARRVDGRCHLICQTSALVVDEVIERSRHAQGLGADALMILPPYLEGPEDDDGLFDFYRCIDATIDVDIIGYNIPQTTGIGISVELFRRLNQLEHFNYIKDSAGDLTRHQEYLATGFNVLNGCDPNTAFAFIAGASGCIWGGANYMPREAVRLYELVAGGDHAGAMALWQTHDSIAAAYLERAIYTEGQGCRALAWFRWRQRTCTAAKPELPAEERELAISLETLNQEL